MMKSENFKPDLCRSCGKLIWTGICRTGFDTEADVERLTVTDQIVAKLNGRHLYRVVRTSVSFSLKPHDKMSIEYYKDPIVLASHTCTTTHLFQSVTDAPNYFTRPPSQTPPSSNHPIPEGFPF
jgi:hypothetical protein